MRPLSQSILLTLNLVHCMQCCEVSVIYSVKVDTSVNNSLFREGISVCVWSDI